MDTGLLLGLCLIGPGIALKAITRGHFNLSAYVFGTVVFFAFYFLSLINTNVPYLLPRILVVVALGSVLLQPAIKAGCSRWNHYCNKHMAFSGYSGWLTLCETVMVKTLSLSAVMGAIAAVLYVGIFDNSVALLLPEWLSSLVYSHLNIQQMQLIGLLSGVIGLLLMLSYRIADNLDDSWLEFVEDGREAITD